ncbi:MAG TPA: hypothetical protein VNO52_18120, partial [Methylomirabilota bacterium]|nr:hypothetical protein [Methylomirabilota bacterium]
QLREASGCDGVLFCRLTHYRAYPPLLIGWHLQLVDASRPRILWSVDEVFDCNDPTVVRAARLYAAPEAPLAVPRANSATVLRSPRQFAEYTVSAVLTTLPAR